MRPGTLATILAVALVGCAAPEAPRRFPDAHDPAYARSFDGERDARVSTSAGEEGGVVLLWPRVVPASEAEAVSAFAAALQDRMARVVAEALPGRAVDRRPAPERACPSSGCRAVAFGAVLAHSDGGCVVVATVARPGESETRLVAWSEGVRASAFSVPFREPPETAVGVTDFQACDDLEALLAPRDPAVTEALRAVAPE